MEYKIETPNKPLNSKMFAQENVGCELYQIDNDLWISGVDSQEEAQALLDAHNPPAPTEPNIVDKLAAAGLTVDELKELLGL